TTSGWAFCRRRIIRNAGHSTGLHDSRMTNSVGRWYGSSFPYKSGFFSLHASPICRAAPSPNQIVPAVLKVANALTVCSLLVEKRFSFVSNADDGGHKLRFQKIVQAVGAPFASHAAFLYAAKRPLDGGHHRIVHADHAVLK